MNRILIFNNNTFMLSHFKKSPNKNVNFIVAREYINYRIILKVMWVFYEKIKKKEPCI